MTELSLNVLDVAQNSVKAEATLIELKVIADTEKDTLSISIKDNGQGMTEEQVKQVTDPFFTSRTTRKVGLGVPLFKMAAEMTGGGFSIDSEFGTGTFVKADFVLSSIDRMPLGNMCDTVETLIVYNTHIDFIYTYEVNGEGFTLSTLEMKEVLEGIPLDSPDVKDYIREYLKENTEAVNKELIL